MPIGTFKIERKNILIEFRWILRILYGAVRARPKPLSMLLDVGVVRRALERDIQGDFKAVSIGRGDELLEIFQSPQLRMDGHMAAFRGTDRPGTANLIRLCQN